MGKNRHPKRKTSQRNILTEFSDVNF